MPPSEDKLDAKFEALLEPLGEFIEEKRRNENRWSSANSLRIAVLVLITATAVVLILVGAPVGLSASAAGAPGVIALATGGLPDDRKRIGNKILAAKATDLLGRVEHWREEIELQGSEPYGLLRQFRYEKNVLDATSSTIASVDPFWSIPPSTHRGGEVR